MTQAIVIYTLLMPITLVGLYCALCGLIEVSIALREGESLWIGLRQTDLYVAHMRAKGEPRDLDSFCLRRRTWRRLKGQ